MEESITLTPSHLSVRLVLCHAATLCVTQASTLSRRSIIQATLKWLQWEGTQEVGSATAQRYALTSCNILTCLDFHLQS